MKKSMRVRWFLLGFLAGALLSFVVYYSAQRTVDIHAKPQAPTQAIAPPAQPAPASAIASPIAGLRRSELRDSFNETHFGHRHEAIDIMEPRGTPVLAVTDGVIAKLWQSKAGGNTIYQFDAAGNYCYYYAHLDHYARSLADGAKVNRGEVIGYVGSTGDASASAPHLHFGVKLADPDHNWSHGTPVDPYPLLLEAAR
jgi:murein DD-endopeptidase MepM/ murein hydrolase activator NlpD